MSRIAKVGLFATVALLLLAIFIVKIESIQLFGKKGPELDAVFDSVAGLNDRTSVRIAGVRVGQVDGITLDGARARVHMKLEQPVRLTEGTSARIATLGMLGESYVELVPGPSTHRELPEGSTVEGVTPLGIDEAMSKLADVADSIASVAEPLAGGLSGADVGSPLGRLVANLEAASGQLRLLIEDNDQQLGNTVRNFETFSGRLAEQLPELMEGIGDLVGQIQAVVAENRTEIAASSENIASLTERLDRAAGDFSVITERLVAGEGTVGKLLTSDDAHDQLVSTMESVKAGVDEFSNTLGRVSKLQLDLDLGGFLLSDRDQSHGTFGLTLRPDKDSNRLYRLALVTTPGGVRNSKTERITVTEADGSISTRTIETLTLADESVINALVGLEFDNNMRVWAGLVEDHFGLAAEVPLFKDRFWLDLQAFDFDREDDRSPHLRLTGRYWLNENVFIQGGYDDPLESQLNSVFIGGGIRWNDDTLKYLLGSLPLGGG